MIYALVIVCCLLLVYLVYLHRLIKGMTRELAQINSVQTNAVLELRSRNPDLIKLAMEISRLLKLSKRNYFELIDTQQQFDQAINNISHDIRTPLTVASGYTQLLARHADEKEGALLAKITHNLHEVEEKLEDLLTYNRLFEQQIEVNFVEVNLSAQLENQIIAYYEAFQTEAIALDLSITKGVRLISDGDLLKRIIDNALGNILNHGAETAKITLAQTGNQVSLTFLNQTKEGSPAINNYTQLFERFYTEDLSRVTKNSGLGLFIIQELTALLNGKVEATGEAEHFVLTLTFPVK